MGSCYSKTKNLRKGKGVAIKYRQPEVAYQKVPEITEECNSLKLSLATAQKEREAAHEQVQHLNLRVHSLENLVRDLQESAESVGRLENERKAAVSNLHQKQSEFETLQKVNSSLECEHTEVVSKLNQQIQELEDKRRKEEERREELAREVHRLQREAQAKQRAIEEADRLKEELVHLKKKAASLPGNHKEEETDEKEELDLTIVEEEMDKKSQYPSEHAASESLLHAWAHKGPIQVYMAKYNYDPFEYSPNENPEAELPLTAGDYVLVVGEMDEDGFFDGELIDGRQGLVPSNFIEKVEDDDLSEFHAALLQAGHGDYSSASTPVVATAMSPTPLARGSAKINNNNNEMNFTLTGSQNQKMDTQNGNNNPDEVNSDLEDIAEMDEDAVSVPSRTVPIGGSINNLPPSPRGLSLDKQLTNSILISWKEPEQVAGLEVQCYHIFVDGCLKTSIKGNERTKALLEGVSSNVLNCVECGWQSGVSSIVVSVVGSLVSAQLWWVWLAVWCQLNCGGCGWQSGVSSNVLNCGECGWQSGVSSIVVGVVGSLVSAQLWWVWLAVWCQLKCGECGWQSGVSSIVLNCGECGWQSGVSSIVVGVVGSLVSAQLWWVWLAVWCQLKCGECGWQSGVSSIVNHRVCVRCLSNKGQSKDAQCTMLIGKDMFPIPSELKVCHVSPTSASLSWLPGDSNYQHSVMLNGKEVRVVKPGVFRYTLTGLAPGTLQKVTLIAKSISGTLIEEKSRKWVENVSASIEFHTPEAGAPEPPLNVQVESGPREGTVLLTWLPVTINSSGVCNGAIVAGYQVWGDKRKLKTISGPTSDHAVLSSEDFKGVYTSNLSVKTVSKAGVESVNSDQICLPAALIKELREGHARSQIGEMAQKISDRGKSSTSQPDEGKGHDTDEEIEAAFREVQSSNDGVNAIMAEPYSDSSSSELSDIPEVEEDLIGSQDSLLNEVGLSQTNQKPSSSQNEKRSPQPAPRKLVGENVDLRPKEFNDKRSKGPILASPSRVVPAIEITRDSSTEQFTEVEEDASTASTGNTPISSPGQPTAVAPHYWGDMQSPSAFRQVDQTRRHDGGGEKGRPGGESTVSISAAPNSVPGPTSTNRSVNQPVSRTHSQDTSSSDHRKHLNSGLEDIGDTDSISEEINPVIDESTVRLFIALFDYDPTTMSPNVDSIDEELPFREGQILKVFGDKDADGFYRGESHGRRGYIPCNMVSEVQIDDPDLVEQLLKETTERPVPDTLSSHSNQDSDLTPNGMSRLPREEPMRRMIALYDYDPQELSPNVDAELELSFKTGDIVMIFGDMDEDGFYTGVVNGQQGLVPSNFLQPAPLSDDEVLESVSVVSAPRSRSGESLDAAVNTHRRADVTANVPGISAPSPPRDDSTGSNKQATSANLADKSDNSRPGTASPAEDEKPKKKAKTCI
ncbi:hypothetical protein Btru_025681 [Bulinus truncatus]|nr:hypothetical protein Btru_025681 [Bulinus truncatus]